MNIFAVDSDPIVAARSLCDKHICKMCLESTQILCTVLWRLGALDPPMRGTHFGHPCVRWAGETKSNFEWLLEHGAELYREYTFRYGRTHAAEWKHSWVEGTAIRPPKGPLTPFVQCIKYEDLRGPDPVWAYRVFYAVDKSRFARWRHGREAPEWWTNIGLSG